jgi:hypothetical protein
LRAEGFVFAEKRSSLLQLAQIYDMLADLGRRDVGERVNLSCF